MSTFLFEMDSNTRTVQLKSVHHKYLAQVRPLLLLPQPQAHSKREVRMKPQGRGLGGRDSTGLWAKEGDPAWQPATKGK